MEVNYYQVIAAEPAFVIFNLAGADISVYSVTHGNLEE